MKAIIIDARREYYSKEEAAEATITAAELIDILSRYDGDEKIVLSHDGGYTYGAIHDERISEPETLDTIETTDEDYLSCEYDK